MASKHEARAEFEFRGEVFEVSPAAIYSMRVQKAMAMQAEDQPGFYRAVDAIFCGHLDEYLDRIPGEDGKVGEFGASIDDVSDMLLEIARKYGKN